MRKENIGLATLGIILLVIGLIATFYTERPYQPYSSQVTRPYQTIGVLFSLVGIGLTAISLYTSLRTT